MLHGMHGFVSAHMGFKLKAVQRTGETGNPIASLRKGGVGACVGSLRAVLDLLLSIY